MTLQHAQAYAASLEDVAERVEVRRGLRTVRARCHGTAESRFAERVIQHLQTGRPKDPSAGYTVLAPSRRERITQRVRDELARS